MLPAVLLEDRQRLLIILNGEQGLVLQIVEIAQCAVELRQVVVYVLLRIAFVATHGVGDGQSHFEVSLSRFVFLPSIVLQSQVIESILTHILRVYPVAQSQHLVTIVIVHFAVLPQRSSHYLIVAVHALLIGEFAPAFEYLQCRVNSGVTMVGVTRHRQTQSNEKGSEAQPSVNTRQFQHICKVTHFFGYPLPKRVEFVRHQSFSPP